MEKMEAGGRKELKDERRPADRWDAPDCGWASSLESRSDFPGRRWSSGTDRGGQPLQGLRHLGAMDRERADGEEGPHRRHRQRRERGEVGAESGVRMLRRWGHPGHADGRPPGRQPDGEGGEDDDGYGEPARDEPEEDDDGRLGPHRPAPLPHHDTGPGPATRFTPAPALLLSLV